MKTKIVILSILISYLSIGVGLSQSREEMISSLDGAFKLESTSVVFSKVIEVEDVDAATLFDRVLPFFSYRDDLYGYEVSVTNRQSNYIIAQGVYKSIIYSFNSALGYLTKINADHVVRVDFKDNRLKVEVTLVSAKEYRSNGLNGPLRYYSTMNYSLMYPANPQEKEKLSRSEKKDLELFYKTQSNVNITFDNILKFAKKDNSSDSDW